MAQNIELKVKLEGFERVLNILDNERVKLEKILNQRDIYYKHPEGLLKLRVFDNNGELIFYQRDETRIDRVSNYHILDVKPEQAENFFQYIFEIETVVVKVRRLYIYKNTRIHLDEVEKLGKFLELETVVKDNIYKGKEEFEEVVKLLNLDVSNQIKSSYRTLMINK